MPATTPILDGNDPAAIERAAALLRAGQLVAMPTETVYGLAGHALDPIAAAAIFTAKQRPSFDPLIVHVPNRDAAEQLATLDALAQQLAEAFWPGPLTLVLPRKPIIPDLITAGLDHVGIRVPAHPVALALLRQANIPLAAPSANRFGSISPTTAQHVLTELDGRIAAILDGGPCTCGVESTVVRIDDGQAVVLRLGALSVEDLQRVVGEVEVRRSTSQPHAPDDAPRPAPGMTDRHYAPGTPMRLVASFDAAATLETTTQRVGLLGIGDLREHADRFAVARSLSQASDLSEAAANLFASLRDLDAAGLDQIIAVAMPEEGLGRAINDRLRRGSV
jgi:L-threonylcarbamoyladenylate synthase